MNTDAILSCIDKSPFLSSRLKNHPEWLELLRDGREPKLRNIEDSETDEAFMKEIRNFKYFHLMRLALLDMAKTKNVREILADWSHKADMILERTFNRSYSICSDKFGEPMKSGTVSKGTVIALGKLGGSELNFSSDVDLIFIYETDNAVTDGGATGKKITAHEFYVRLVSLFTKFLAGVTEEGFAFRVDHELRPEGMRGPLANSLEAAVRYYESFGLAWERQALIRARPVAGDTELGKQFISEMRPFVYPRSITIKDIANMKEMKRKMEAHAARCSDTLDIKHGRGGIREVEFLVQAMMTLYGGTHETLRCTNTFDAIIALGEKSLIHPYGTELLTEAYSFLRRLENMIQIENDVQTHSLPVSPASMARLAIRMGNSGDNPAEQAEGLKNDISRYTCVVERLFSALFEEDYERQELCEAMSDNLLRCINEEEETDSLAWFVRNETYRIARSDLEDKFEPRKLFDRLTLTAEVVIKAALDIAKKHVTGKHGTPLLVNGALAEFVILGMGRLGSREMDYGSDLDLCFFYSGEGTTDGTKPISNAEYFTKLAQRIITLITLPTRYGRAYAVDSELRPSGRSGALVTPIDAFEEYHIKNAMVWERLSLLKARVLAGDRDFSVIASDRLKNLAFNRPAPPHRAVRDEIDNLHNRALIERSSENQGQIDIKFAAGGLMELELAIQFYHLMNAHAHIELWKNNSFEVLDEMLSCGIFTEEFYRDIMEELMFFRTLISKTRLITRSSTNSLQTSGEQTEVIANKTGFTSAAQLLSTLKNKLVICRRIYQDAIKRAHV